MKRILALVLVVAMMLSFTACKSKEAAAVDDQIADIGVVTLDSGDKIADAEAAVEALADEDKEQLENVGVLEDARAAYEELVIEKAVAEVEEAISAIGTVTMENAAVVEAAQEKYDALDYDVKDRVSNYATLTSAQSTLKALKKEQADAILSTLRCDEDKVRNLRFYYPSSMNFYSDGWAADIRSFMLPYLGVDEDSAWLRLLFNYTDDDWIFFEKVIISVDGKNYTKYYDYFDVTRDNGGGDIWEYMDDTVSDSDVEMLWAVVNSTETILRFEGDDYYDDVIVSAKDKAGIAEILEAYELLK